MDVAELEENFAFFDTWEDKYSYLIDLGKAVPPMPDVLKTDGTKVNGCLSQVWYFLQPDDGSGTLRILADSDSAIVRGLIAVLLTVYDGRPPDQIAGQEAHDLFTRLGFSNHISPNRRNGFAAMVGRIEALATKRAQRD